LVRFQDVVPVVFAVFAAGGGWFDTGPTGGNRGQIFQLNVFDFLMATDDLVKLQLPTLVERSLWLDGNVWGKREEKGGKREGKGREKGGKREERGGKEWEGGGKKKSR
jgi:hypothetical protein